MFFNLDKELDRQRFSQRVRYLLDKRKKVELKEKRRKRTLNQNSYLHLILSWYGLETGHTLDEVKQEIFKRGVCADIFRYEKNGKMFYHSTADLNTKEMTIAIDVFRDHASKFHGIYLPEPNEQEQLRSMEEQLSRYGNRQYV